MDIQDGLRRSTKGEEEGERGKGKGERGKGKGERGRGKGKRKGKGSGGRLTDAALSLVPCLSP